MGCAKVARSGGAAAPAVEAIDLVKHFGATKAVDGVSFSIPGGTVLGLLGPNGAGKTTRVRMLTTLSRPTSGTGRVNGHDIVDNPSAVRRSMGLTGQAATVDELLTGRENVRLIGRLYGLPLKYLRESTDELMERFRLTDAADRLAKTYSGGMRRRLDLAVSLVAAPPVLFLDEPTTGLDPRSRVELWDVLRGLVQDGTPLLLTTQYLEEADQLADQIVVIDHGTVIASGTPAQLKEEAGKASDVLAGGACRAGQPAADRTGRRPAGHDAHRRRAARQRRRRRRPRTGPAVVDSRVAQPAAHQTNARDAARRHHPAGDVRAAVRVRLRRVHQRARHRLPRVPAARHHGPDHRLLLFRGGRRAHQRPGEGHRRPLQIAAHVAGLGAGRAQRLQPDPLQHRHRRDGRAPGCSLAGGCAKGS